MENYKEKLEEINKKLETENELCERVLLLLARKTIENLLEEGDF